ncbi:sperm receptor for egg jelly-like [Gigantopelta aegis]|uniref:sperm receptor for egg jelly-like n=1 Tax=Gigantopelta aegis TaxID=1735272 RepID=UPI001B8889AA|nr:sperm receptor for egg jelly-like [Gigantopelta aegis]
MDETILFFLCIYWWSIYGIQSDTEIMLDKQEVSLFDTVRVSMTIRKDITFNYSAEIGDLSCRPDFKTHINPQNKNEYLYSMYMYKTTKVGQFSVSVNIYGTESVTTDTFRVTSPEPLINHCLEEIQIKGASYKSFDERVYNTVDDIRFTLSNERGCGSDFEINKYKWTFSRFESETYNFCISDDSFKVSFSSSTDNGVLVVKKLTLLDGYFKVCLQVDGNYENKIYSEINVTCGYFRMKPVALGSVTKPSDLHQSVVYNRRFLLGASDSKDPNTGDNSNVRNKQDAIKAIIKPPGNQTVVYNRPILLDASDSIDPNTGDNSGLSYDWSCTPVGSHRSCKFLPRYNPQQQGPILEIPENTLPVQKTFNFTVSVSKPGLPSGTASLIIFVTSGTRPNAKITCSLGCDNNKTIPSKPLALEVHCENCGPFGITISAYVWKLFKMTKTVNWKIVPLSDWVSKSLTGYNKRVMSLPPGTLNVSSKYEFNVQIFYNKNASKVMHGYRFSTDKSPEGGSCSVNPTSGQALITKFTVFCPGYMDNDSPLTYSVYLKKKGKSDTLLYQGNEETTSLILPAGPQSNSWLQQLTVYISDSFDSSTIYLLTVQVENNQDDEKTFLKSLNDLATEAVEEKPSDFLLKSLVIVDMLETVKTENHNTTAEKEQKTKIREQLLSNLKTVKDADKGMLLQMSDLLYKLIAQEDNITPTMETDALTVTTSLACVLKEISKSHPNDARNIAKTQCNALVTLMDKQVKEDTEYKQIAAKTKPVLDVLETISDCLLESVQSEIEGPVNIQSDQMSLTVQQIEPTVDAFNIIANPQDHDKQGGSILFPNDMKSGTDKPFDLQMMIMKKNPFQWSPTADVVNLPVMKISVKNDGKSLNPSDLSVPADIFISVNLSNVMEEDKIFTLNVTYDTINHKVKNSSTVRVIIPVIKGKTQVVKMFAVDSPLKLEVVLGASESEVSFRNLELHGFDWPVEDEAGLTYKNHKQDPHLLFLPEDILGTNDTNFYLVIRVKVSFCLWLYGI